MVLSFCRLNPKMRAVFLVFAIGLGCVLAQNPICKEVSVNNQEILNGMVLPKEFVVDIELVIKETSEVHTMTMYYSQAMKTIRLDLLKNQVKTSMYFYFQENEILKFDFKPSNGRGKCTVLGDIEKNVNNFLLGGVDPSSTSPSIPAPLAVLHFTGKSGFPGGRKIQEHSQGVASTRDIPSDQLTSCQHWKSKMNDIVLNVTHYFAREVYNFPYDKSNPMDTNPSFPTLLSMDLKGTGTFGSLTNYRIDHTYNFVNFRGLQDDGSFETPGGIVCNGRKNTKAFPKMPPFFSFGAEVIDNNAKSLLLKEEVYDYTQNYAIMKVIKKLGSTSDSDTVTMVFDIFGNAVLIIDEVESSCQKMPLTEFKSENFDVFTVKQNKAVMNDPQEFFLASPNSFTYLGQKKIRDMITDVWVAPANIKGLSNPVVQYHMATSVSSWNDKNPQYIHEKWSMPVKVKVFSDENEKGLVENVFDVDYNPLRPDYIDLSPCYHFQINMQIVVKANRSQIVGSYYEAFAYELRKALAQVGTISFNQVAQLKLYYTSDVTFIEFIVGGDSKTQVTSAVKAMTENLKSGSLTVKALDPKTKKWTVPLPLVEVNSVNVYAGKNAAAKQTSKSTDNDSGYSKGSMAGLGIGMVVVGLAGGAGAGFAHSKFFG